MVKAHYNKIYTYKFQKYINLNDNKKTIKMFGAFQVVQ